MILLINKNNKIISDWNQMLKIDNTLNRMTIVIIVKKDLGDKKTQQ